MIARRAARSAEPATRPHSHHALQSLLDANSLLIHQINANHQLRTPDALERNIALIRDLNANVNTVVAQYQALTDSLATRGGVPPAAQHAEPQAASAPQQQLQPQQQQRGGQSQGSR
jgi:DNA-binding transcriptional MocR family regulator